MAGRGSYSAVEHTGVSGAGLARAAGKRSSLFRGLCACVLTVGCTAGQGPVEDRPSVLLVTLASTRADHLEPYGGSQARTPTLRRVAGEGVVFERAYAASPVALPSDATLLTGLNPPAHGLRDEGGRLPDDVHTLAERLSERGYLSVAFTGSAAVGARWGLDQGFALFSGPGSDGALPVERGAAAVVDEAINALYRARAPVFAWVELPLAAASPGGAAPDPRLDPEAAYDASISATDAELGRLLSWWDRAFPDAVQIITADHGLALGEGGEQGSGALLSDATLRVPLLLRGSGAASDRVPVGERVSDPVGIVDIAPTVLALTDLRGVRTMEGNDLLDEGSERVYSEAVAGWARLGLAPLTGYTDVDGRYVEGAWGAWYPVSGPRVSEAADPSQSVRDASKRLARLREGLGARVADEVMGDLDEAVGLGGDLTAAPGLVDPRNAPELLGLLAEARQRMDAGQLWAAEQRVRHLESLTEDAWGVAALRVQLSLRQGRLDEAVALLGELYQRQPGDNLAFQLGTALSAAGRWEEAGPWFDAVLASRPEDPGARAGRARAALALGDLDTAELLLAQLDEDAPAPLQLARVELLLAQDRADSALVQAEAIMALDPTQPDALAAVASARWALGSPDAAIDLMGEAINEDRYNLGFRARLATWLLELGLAEDAARLMAPAASLSPQGGAVRDLYEEARRAASGSRPG